MAKDPAFLFYPNDYIGGTMGMTFEEKGAYMELLMLQFNRGHMTSRMVGQTVGQLWDKVQDKFIKDKDGLFFNERLDIEKTKRRKYTESRNNNTSGKNQYTEKHKKKDDFINGHMTSHMEDVNKDVNTNGIINNKEEKEILKNWEYEKRNFLMDEPWQMRFCTERKTTCIDLKKMMQEFITTIELKEDFKDAKELKRHFTNVFDKNKKDNFKFTQNGTKITNGITHSSKSAGAYELLERIKKERGIE